MGKVSEMRAVYELPEFSPNFMETRPPIKQGYGSMFEKGNIKFFQDYRNETISRYMPPMYRWGEAYTPYSPRPDIVLSHRKQRWEEMLAKPTVPLTFVDQSKRTEMDNFYLLCQFQRQYYNDYSGGAHPMDFFERDIHRWRCPPDLNRHYIQFPQMFVKYKHPLTLPLTLKRTWPEPLEPFRRLAGKYSPEPCIIFPR